MLSSARVSVATLLGAGPVGSRFRHCQCGPVLETAAVAVTDALGVVREDVEPHAIGPDQVRVFLIQAHDVGRGRLGPRHEPDVADEITAVSPCGIGRIVVQGRPAVGHLGTSSRLDRAELTFHAMPPSTDSPFLRSSGGQTSRQLSTQWPYPASWRNTYRVWPFGPVRYSQGAPSPAETTPNRRRVAVVGGGALPVVAVGWPPSGAAGVLVAAGESSSSPEQAAHPSR